MSVTCGAHLQDMHLAFLFAATKAQLSEDYLGNALTDWMMGNDHAAVKHIIDAGRQLTFAVQNIIREDYPEDGQCSIPQYFYNCVNGDNGLTMDELILCMYGADSNNVYDFMGLLTAYKHAVWDMPWSEDFYAHLSRMFKP